MVADGRETGGGMAKGTMAASLRALSVDRTEVVAEASVDLTGRLMQVGRGMIQGVARQLFQQFAEAVQRRLAVAAAAAASDGSTPATVTVAPPPAEPEAIRVVPLLLRTLWSAIVRLWRRMLGSEARSK